MAAREIVQRHQKFTEEDTVLRPLRNHDVIFCDDGTWKFTNKEGHFRAEAPFEYPKPDTTVTEEDIQGHQMARMAQNYAEVAVEQSAAAAARHPLACVTQEGILVADNELNERFVTSVLDFFHTSDVDREYLRDIGAAKAIYDNTPEQSCFVKHDVR